MTPTNRNLENLLTLFENQQRGRLAPNTIERVLRDIRMIAKDMYIQNLDEMTTEVIVAWGNGRLAGYFGRKPMQRASLAAVHGSIRSFLKVLDELEISHAVKRKSLIWYNKHKPRKALRAHDIQRVLSFAEDPEIAVLANLLFYTGMRISEALPLRAEHIAEDNTVWVSGKSKNDRIVVLNKQLREDMASLHGDEGYYFRDRFHTENPMNRKVAYYRLTTLYRKAGYPKGFSPHSERHGHATELLSRGANLAIVSKDMGHAHIETTQIYTHLVTDDVVNTVRQHMPVMASFN